MVMARVVYGYTDVGKVRSHNEDCYTALGGDTCSGNQDALLIVADGMGGLPAGEVASRMAVDGLVGKLWDDEDRFKQFEGDGLGAALWKAMEEVNREIYVAGQFPPNQGMGTTCTAAAIRGDQLYLAHLGDSRAYLLRNGAMHQLTTDHTWVEEAVVSGVISRDAARSHPNRNLITRAVGLDSEVEADRHTLSLEDGDLLLLCSDGLSSMVSDEEISVLLLTNRLDEMCTTLIDAANWAGGHDSITVAVAYIGHSPVSNNC